MMRIAVSKLGVNTVPCLLKLPRNYISRQSTTYIFTRGISASVPPSCASPGSSALDSVVFPSVFPFKVIAEHSPALTQEILQKARALLLTGTETVVPHTVTLKGRFMSLTLLPVLQRVSQVRACVCATEVSAQILHCILLLF
jgi:putative lipoic acid-binding regulatory protein